MEAQGFFLVSISIFDMQTFVFEWDSAMKTPQHTQDSSLKPSKIRVESES